MSVVFFIFGVLALLLIFTGGRHGTGRLLLTRERCYLSNPLESAKYITFERHSKRPLWVVNVHVCIRPIADIRLRKF